MEESGGPLERQHRCRHDEESRQGHEALRLGAAVEVRAPHRRRAAVPGGRVAHLRGDGPPLWRARGRRHETRDACGALRVLPATGRDSVDVRGPPRAAVRAGRGLPRGSSLTGEGPAPRGGRGPLGAGRAEPSNSHLRAPRLRDRREGPPRPRHTSRTTDGAAWQGVEFLSGDRRRCEFVNFGCARRHEERRRRRRRRDLLRLRERRAEGGRRDGPRRERDLPDLRRGARSAPQDVEREQGAQASDRH